jgi:hypothetical protein
MNTEQDKLLHEAARLIFKNKSASVSFLQRRMRLEWNRAGRIMDLLEEMGVVGPNNAAKPRDILVASEYELNLKFGITDDYGTATVGYGTSDQREIKVIDFVKARFNDDRLISVCTLENNEGYIVSVENPKSTGRSNQQLFLSSESFSAVFSTMTIFLQCKEFDPTSFFNIGTNGGTIDYSFSPNLKPIEE